MKTYKFIAGIALGALFSYPVQAAPLASGTASLKAQAGHEVQQVYHCRYYSEGWNCGWGDLRPQHERWFSHHRDGSSYGGGGYSGGGGGGHGDDAYEGFGHLRLWSHRRNGSDYYGGDHSRHMSHQRYQSWKKDF